jgi:hypothetical protein
MASSRTPASPKPNAQPSRRTPRNPGTVRAMTQHPASINTTVAAYPYIRYGMYTRGEPQVAGHKEGATSWLILSRIDTSPWPQRTGKRFNILTHSGARSSYNKQGMQRPNRPAWARNFELLKIINRPATLVKAEVTRSERTTADG